MVDPMNMGVGFSALFSIISLIVMLPLSALGLWLSGKIFKIQIAYVKALVPAAILTGIGFLISMIITFIPQLALWFIIPINVIGLFFVTLIIYLTLPKLFFNLEWGKGMLVGLVWFGIMLVAGFIVGLIIGMIALAIGMAIGLAAL